MKHQRCEPSAGT